jgi:hypothetical protein
MDVTIKRLFCTPWYQDEGVYGCNNVCTEPISLDSQTLAEIEFYRHKKFVDGEVETDWIVKYLHDKSVGKISDIGDNKYIKCMRLGELELSIQLSYYLYCIRNDADHGKLMTEDEFQYILHHNHIDGTDILDPANRYVDIYISNNVTDETYVAATQWTLREIDQWLGCIILKRSMNCMQ